MTLEEEITELKRELATREKVYPEWIRHNKISKSVAEHRKACLKSTIERLEKLLKENTGEQKTLF